MPRGPIEKSLNTIASPTFTGSSTFTGPAYFADGTAAAPSIAFANYPTDGVFHPSGEDVIALTGGSGKDSVAFNVGAAGTSPRGIRLASDGQLSWFDTTSLATATANDLFLARDAANTLALRNGVNGQAFRLYDSYTDESTHTGWELNADTAGSFLLRYRNNGTFSTVGTFTSGGAFTGAGAVSGSTTGSLSTGTEGAVVTVASGGYVGFAGRNGMRSPADGVFTISNDQQTNLVTFTLADWGTTTSAEAVSLANDASVLIGAAISGTCHISYPGDASIFFARGTANASALVSGSATFTVTKDNAATVNFYYDAAGASGAGYYLQNKTGGALSFRVACVGG